MAILRKGDKGNEVFKLQEGLIKLGYSDIISDGIFGPKTENAVIDYQRTRGLAVDGVVGQNTYEEICSELIPGMHLTEDDYINAAKELDVEVAVIKAFSKVESGGRSAFLSPNKPVILFEGHVFWRQLNENGLDPNNFIKGNSDILFPKMNSKSYKGGTAEYDRLNRAINIDEKSAYESISSGKFQILGNNAESLGYKSAKEMYMEFSESEYNQLLGFIKFIKADSVLHKALRDKNWSKAAERYNGKNYKTYNYDIKLANAYRQYK